MFTGPVGPVEVFFTGPKLFLGIFYWPGAIDLLLALSPVYVLRLVKGVIEIMYLAARFQGALGLLLYCT